MQTQLTSPVANYSQLIAALVKTLSAEKAAQLYAFARFLSADDFVIPPVEVEDDINFISDAELAHEDELWAASMARHADEFAELKAKAKADAKAGKAIPAYDENGEFVLK